jgi:uncharacterized protein YndB with AHSA1/START domain
MSTPEKKQVTISATVNAPVEKTWDYFFNALHIVKWNSPSEDWHTPSASGDLRPGGKFTSRMEAKDGSMGFDFGGVYDEVIPHEFVSYTMGDGRKVNIRFTATEEGTSIVENFDPEDMNPVEFQQAGWQAILNSFKTYTENN